MGSTLARIYVVLSAAILLVVGVVGFFRHEMFNLTFPPAHNVFHLVSGAIGLWAGLRNNANAVRRFGQIFGAIYTLVAIAGFAGLRDFGPIQLDLNTHFNFIHLGVGLLSLAASLAAGLAGAAH
jgi:hypothetical protein